MIPTVLRSDFEQTLITGGYNLLLGSGITMDSTNADGKQLLTTEQLRLGLCDLVGVSKSTPLTKVSSILTENQRFERLTKPFSDCTPGPSLSHLPHYMWRNIFTFNIDDVLEKLYTHYHVKKQTLIPINFDEPFQIAENKGELLGIHLHGWVQKPNSGYVFSTSEYARVIRGLNPWMHMLSEILATEPFIIAGTSLNEVDLEYYLSNRTTSTPHRGRGPSLFIEPNPDKVTTADCDRYGLTLIPATFDEFLNWLYSTYPTPPNTVQLLVPDISKLFSEQPEPRELIEFFSDFELLNPVDLPLPSHPTRFMYGREPEWRDIDQHLDVERKDNSVIVEDIKQRLAFASSKEVGLLIISDEAGTGKTTIIKRVAHDLAVTGIPVLNVCTTSRINTHAAKECLKQLTTKGIILVDGIADHIEQILELLEDSSLDSKFIVLGSERSYRREYIDIVLRPISYASQKLDYLSTAECTRLIERYRNFGLIGSAEAIKYPGHFARQIMDEPIAVSICRIMNDFRPLDRIISSLWEASDVTDQMIYLCVALSEHCQQGGILYSILQSIAGQYSIKQLLELQKPLNLTESPVNNEYVIVANSIVGERILLMAVNKAPDILFSAFESTARALASRVNRRAIMRRTPEARLAGRLFDYDKIVRPLLRESANGLYISAQSEWEWNSRFWEQRALLTAETDLQTGIQHARHAVAIETHPFPLTTLAKLLLKEMENEPSRFEESFSEAFDKLTQAIQIEHSRSRITVHPFSVLLNGTALYLEMGGKLNTQKRSVIDKYSNEAVSRFDRDLEIIEGVKRIGLMLNMRKRE